MRGFLLPAEQDVPQTAGESAHIRAAEQEVIDLHVFLERWFTKGFAEDEVAMPLPQPSSTRPAVPQAACRVECPTWAAPLLRAAAAPAARTLRRWTSWRRNKACGLPFGDVSRVAVVEHM